MEIWKDVPSWEGLYEVSNFGRCRSVRTGKIKPLDVNNCGYSRLQCYDGKRRQKLFVHRLVALLFVDGYKDGLVVNHKDGDKSNNMFSNLEWVTRSDNNKHAFHIGLKDRNRKDTPCYLEMPKTNQKVFFNTVMDASKSIGLSDKRLHHLIKTQGGYIPEVDMYIRKCVSND